MRKKNRKSTLKMIVIRVLMLAFPVTAIINHPSTAIKALKDILNL